MVEEIKSLPRILFQPVRSVRFGRGGDYKQMLCTIAALRARGYPCDISEDITLDLSPYALVHLYNLSDPYSAIPYLVNARRQKARVVVTPIYWTHQQWLAARAQYPDRAEFDARAQDAAEAARAREVTQREQALYVAVQRWVVSNAAAVLAQAPSEAEWIARELGAPREKIHVAYNGVEPQYAQGDAASFTARYGVRDFVLSVARIEERKNTIGIIRAWRGEQTPLVLVGHAPDARYLQLCRDAADSNVIFTGRLEADQVAAAYAAARVHVLASWWEEASNAALEAACAGCNLVMTQYSSARDYFGDAVWLCDPADENSIHRALCEALAAPRQTTLAARIREQFTWQRTAQAVSDAYHAACALPQEAWSPTYAADLEQIVEQLGALYERKQEHQALLAQRADELRGWLRELEQMSQMRAGRTRWNNLPRVRGFFRDSR